MNKHNNSSVLFFGRNSCDASKKILNELNRLDFQVTYVESNKRGEKMPLNIIDWHGDYIICFRSLFFLSKKLINNAKIAAINFHPGPPEYPGSGCINFALYDEKETFGTTAHLMNEKIDNGKILEVKRFPIHENENLPDLLSRTHDALFEQCIDFINNIERKGEVFIREKLELSKNVKWNGLARKIKDLDKLLTIDPRVSKDELKRIIRATYIEGFPPKILLHGYEFELKITQKND